MTVELVTTDGFFFLDDRRFEVTNNIWLVGDDKEVMVIDASHDHKPIVEAVAGRRVEAIVCTHGDNDHINAAVKLREELEAPILLHPADRMLWDATHPEAEPDRDLMSGEVLAAGGYELGVMHTPGHSQGSCCFLDIANDTVFTGDTLFNGGPGSTERSYGDEATILRSIRDRLLILPDQTIVHTGHGDSTTIGAEREKVLKRITQLEIT